MTGACEGAASGAGMRLSNVGLGAGDAPNSVVGFRTNPPRPNPCPPPPPRAKLGVDPMTHAAANTIAKTRFMTVTPCYRDAPYVSGPLTERLATALGPCLLGRDRRPCDERRRDHPHSDFRNSFHLRNSAPLPISYVTNRNPALSRRAALQQGRPTKSKMDQGQSWECAAHFEAMPCEERLLDLVIAILQRTPIAAYA